MREPRRLTAIAGIFTMDFTDPCGINPGMSIAIEQKIAQEMPPLPPDGHFLHKGSGNTIPATAPLPLPLIPLADTAAAAASLHRDGLAWFPHVLDRERVARLRAWMDAQGGDDASYTVPKWCFNKHLAADWHRNPELLDLVDRQPVLAAAKAVLGDDCQVVGGSLWITGPGRQMGLHLDYQPLTVPTALLRSGQVQMPIFIATAHYYLDDLTLDHGPTTVIPGSHLAGRPPAGETDWEGHPPQALVLGAGDCVLFRSDLWHGAAANNGPHRRYLVQVHYANVYIQRQLPPVTDTAAWAPACLELMTPERRRLFGDLPNAQRGSYIAPERLHWSQPMPQ